MTKFADVTNCLFGNGQKVKDDAAFIAKAKELMVRIAKDIGFTKRDFVIVGEVPPDYILTDEASRILSELRSIAEEIKDQE